MTHVTVILMQLEVDKCSVKLLTSINFDAWLVICRRSHDVILLHSTKNELVVFYEAIWWKKYTKIGYTNLNEVNIE